MKKQIKCSLKPYIQPFERKLALAELATLTASKLNPQKAKKNDALEFTVITTKSAELLSKRLVYWEYVYEQRKYFTTQVQREATVNIVRNGIPLEQIAKLIPFNSEIPLPNRRCLRYGTHGIHEYRGKFFPQLVRALMNAAGIYENSIVADPMNGSGTTIVEAVLGGCHGLGLDINPLSVLIGQTKCSLLSIEPKVLIRAYENIRQRLLNTSTLQSSIKLNYFSSLPTKDREYLSGWFSEIVLRDLDQIASLVHSLRESPIRDFMRLSLSNIVRKVSWQKEDDLRVRKEIKANEDIDPIKEFLEELGRSVRTVLAFLYQNQRPTGAYDIREGDAREITKHWNKWLGKVDIVITSPPYATALPYLDTDRLSLSYLGLLPRSEYRGRDRKMIGNREIAEKERQYYLALFKEKQSILPESVIKLISKIEQLNSTTEIGFRRRNLPALLSKYFFDLREVLEGITKLLKPGAPAFIVVGDNHTIAGGQRVSIETSKLLVDVAATVGLELKEVIPMEMLSSRDIFKNNAVSTEAILSFRNPI